MVDIADWRASGQGFAAVRNFNQANVALGSCVTSIAGPHGGAQLYER
jgi:hypothetical protein